MKRVKNIILVLSLWISFSSADLDWDKMLCGFSDVSWKNQYCMEIHKGKIEGVITGYGEAGNPLKPNNSITRAELTTIVVRSNKENIEECKSVKPFNDVSIDEWYCKYINTAKNLQWIKGVQGGSQYFEPNEPINLAQALKIMIVGYSISSESNDAIHKVYNSKSGQTYIFNENLLLNNWFDTYVNWAKENHLTLFDKDNLDLSKPILREEVLNMYKEVDDVFTCHVSEGIEKVIQNENPNFYQNRKPTCYEKALYYSYLKFGSKILQKESSFIKGNMKQIEQVKMFFDLVIKYMGKALTSEIGVSDSCSDKRDEFQYILNKTRMIDKNNNKIIDGVPLDVLTMTADVYMHYCQIKKYSNFPSAEKDIRLKLIIKGIFDSFKIVNNLIGVKNLNNETRKIMSINVAYAFLGEYYSFGGDMEALATKYTTTINLDNLVKEIAKKNSYRLEEEIRGWEFTEVTFDLELTKSYIQSVMDIVEGNYRGVM